MADSNASSKKILAGIMGILFGAFGVHKFVLGYTAEGVIMLVVSVVGFILCGVPTAVMAIIGLIEGIIILRTDDDEFALTYINGKKKWF